MSFSRRTDREHAPLPYRPLQILLTDDEATFRLSIQRQLERGGHDVTTAASGEETMKIAKRLLFDVALIDLHLPDTNGIDLCRELRTINPNSYQLIITADGSIDTAVEAMREGIHDYLTKPIHNGTLIERLHKIGELIEIRAENATLKSTLRRVNGFSGVIGNSKTMREVGQRIELASSSDLTVLITGETGTGKEVAAEAIHRNSGRADKPLIKFSCCTLAENLIESEIFGHEKGAFTGAQKSRAGRFELADGGTIFLDDIDDTPLDVQAKLLRVLETSSFERVGGNKTISVDVRVIAATKKNLFELAEEGRFRTDLCYRLSVIPVHLPRLEDRVDDIPLLASHFLRQFCHNDDAKQMEPDAMRELMGRPWPGNVRQLKNSVEFLAVSCPGERISAEQVRHWLSTHGDLRPRPTPATGEVGPLTERLETFERQLLMNALARSTNKAEAAKLLDIPPSTLKSKLKKYGM